MGVPVCESKQEQALPLLSLQHVLLMKNTSYCIGVLLPDDLTRAAFVNLQMLNIDNNGITAIASPVSFSTASQIATSSSSSSSASSSSSTHPETDSVASGSAAGATSSAFTAVGGIGQSQPQPQPPDASNVKGSAAASSVNARPKTTLQRPPGNWCNLRILSANNNAIVGKKFNG